MNFMKITKTIYMHIIIYYDWNDYHHIVTLCHRAIITVVLLLTLHPTPMCVEEDLLTQPSHFKTISGVCFFFVTTKMGIRKIFRASKKNCYTSPCGFIWRCKVREKPRTMISNCVYIRSTKSARVVFRVTEKPQKKENLIQTIIHRGRLPIEKGTR